jgi:hypothetical protein
MVYLRLSANQAMWDEATMCLCSECCVLSVRGLCDGPIAHPEESTERGVSECDLETSTTRPPWPTKTVEPWKEKLCSS